LAEAQGCLPRGFEVAHDQIFIKNTSAAAAFATKGAPLSIADDGAKITVASPKVSFTFDRAAGAVTSYRVGGTEYFAEGFGLQPNFWRAPTDNDYGNSMPRRLHVWKESSRNFKVTEASAQKEGDAVRLTVTYLLAAGNTYKVGYTVWPSGAVEVEAAFASAERRAVNVGPTEAQLEATFTPGAAEGRKRA
ncbi:MAG: beta-galactosidase, partial [Paramuribaculum sp.]|nr:beta-galactosidase [Paramuribaculum sp.]